MAYCSQCGKEVKEGARFCGSCGASIEEVDPPQAAPAGQPQYTAGAAAPQSQVQTQAQPAPAAYVPSAQAAGQQPQPQYTAAAPQAAPVGQPQYAAVPAPQPAQPPAEKSPLSKAWADYKSSPSKMMIALKLALFQFIPGVGALVKDGYVFTWGKEQALGKSTPMPEKIVRPGVLDSGLYVFGVSLILTALVALISWVVTALFGALDSAAHVALFSGIASLLLLVFLIFVYPYINLLYMRTALCGRLRSGLKFKEAWELFSAKGKMGKLMSSYWGPSALLCVITILLLIIFIGLVVALGVSSIASLEYYSNSLAGVAGIIGVLVSVFPLLIIFLFVLFFVQVSVELIVARAYGYWLQDFNPAEWPEYKENSAYYAEQTL